MSTSTKKKTRSIRSTGSSARPAPITYLAFTIHDDAVMKRIGAEVRRIRTEREIFLSTMAERVGVSLQFLSECERGTKRFTGEILGKVAKALGQDVDVVDLVLAGGACRRCCGSGVEPQKEARS